MGERMECPGCRAYSSSVIADVQDGEPCRFCGLSDGARSEIWAVRAKKANKEVTEQCELLIKRNADLEAVNRDLQSRFDAAFEALSPRSDDGSEK